MSSYNKMAKVYDQLINEDINYEDIADFLLNVAKKENVKFDNYLDLACGTGNVGIHVCKEFNENYFVDLSEDMLTEVEQKLRDNDIKAKILCQDMCELDLNNKFNLISCVLDSTNYILEDEDLEDYFRGVYNHLDNSGVFIFDINSYYKLSEILGNNIYTYDNEEIFYTWENIFEDDIVEMSLTFFVKDGYMYERFDEVHEERAYREQEIEAIIKKIGFKIIDKKNGYTDLPIKEDTERILYILKK
ncbi:MAG: class I SAM-dependent DNA methyltransferase [Sarcina sp.]